MTSRSVRRFLVLASIFLLVASLAFSAAVLDAATPRQGVRVNLGPADQFQPGTVTTFLLRDGHVQHVTEMPRNGVPEIGIHVARLPDGRVRAFSWRGPESGRVVWWMPDLVGFEPDGYFIDTGDSSRWYYNGGLALGPARRNLDRYDVHIDDRGRVIVDVSTTVRGGDPPPPPMRAAAR